MSKANPKKCTIKMTRESARGNNKPLTFGPYTLEEAIKCFSYTLECGASYQHEKGNKKINRSPKSFKTLISNLNNASDNRARNGCGDYYEIVEDAVVEAVTA